MLIADLTEALKGTSFVKAILLGQAEVLQMGENTMRLIMCLAGLLFIVGLAHVAAAPNLPLEDVNGEPIVVDIDIKPNNADNFINLNSKGLLAAAILSFDAFDATSVDVTTVELAGAKVATKGKRGKWLAHVEDVNDDGLLDLVCQFETQSIDPQTFVDGFAQLDGLTLAGELFEGWDDVTVMEKGKQKSRR